VRTGAHLRSILVGLKTPHTLAFVQDKNQLFVADGGDASVKVFAGTTDHQLARIPLRRGPDAGLFDPATRRFYVGNGGKADESPNSTISAIDVDSLHVIRRITLASMAIDHGTQTLNVDTLGGKTSECVPAVARFFVPHTRTAAPAAALQVFSLNE
jgi:DNA-binding beta-propeller fold protein YncE